VSDIIEAFGFDTASNTDIFIFCAIFTFAVVTIIWVIGLFQGNHSMMDGYYGFGYAIPAVIAFEASGAISQYAAVLLVMVLLHGCRLGYYLAARWKRYVPVYGGDPRYLNFVKELSPGYWWKSFFKVMEPQAVIIVLIGSPAVVGILESRGPDSQLNALAYLGIAVFAVGLYFESLADGQLQSFLALPKEGRPRYLNTGVWTHTRHPNYFGTSTVWWGMWLVAVAGNWAAWWTVAGPLINTIMLTSVLGSKFQDDYMGSRPDYQELMRRTRRFLPLPVSKSQAAEPAEEATPAGERETVGTP
jgi:steroid 5-alpha reductase family enzyme